MSVDIKSDGKVSKKKFKGSFYVPSNGLDVPPQIKEFCKENNLVYRWISHPQLVHDGGYHKKGYLPLNLKEYGIEIPGYGSGAGDGFLRYGDTILAVLSEDLAKVHRNTVEEKRRLYNQVDKNAKQDLYKKGAEARRAGLGVKILEDEDND